jgi:prevent-host-death family protein
MTKRTVTIAEAKNELPKIVHSAERGQPIEITRRGRPVAAIVSLQDYLRLQAATGGFWKSLQSFLRRPELKEARRVPDFADGLRDAGTGRRIRV